MIVFLNFKTKIEPALPASLNIYIMKYIYNEIYMKYIFTSFIKYIYNLVWLWSFVQFNFSNQLLNMPSILYSCLRCVNDLCSPDKKKAVLSWFEKKIVSRTSYQGNFIQSTQQASQAKLYREFKTEIIKCMLKNCDNDLSCAILRLKMKCDYDDDFKRSCQTTSSS